MYTTAKASRWKSVKLCICPLLLRQTTQCQLHTWKRGLRTVSVQFRWPQCIMYGTSVCLPFSWKEDKFCFHICLIKVMTVHTICFSLPVWQSSTYPCSLLNNKKEIKNEDSQNDTLKSPRMNSLKTKCPVKYCKARNWAVMFNINFFFCFLAEKYFRLKIQEQMHSPPPPLQKQERERERRRRKHQLCMYMHHY